MKPWLFVVVLTAAFGVAQSAPAAEGGVPPATASDRGVRVVDLAQLVGLLSKQHPGKPDLSQSFYGSASASVHLHVIGPGHATPLHIHPDMDEVTAIVTGAPEITLAYARAGKRASRTITAKPGVLVCSPPFAGHEWRNTATRGAQANLVFAAPPFDRNLSLGVDDPRLLKGTEPFILDPEGALRIFTATGQSSRIIPLPMRREKMAAMFVGTEGAIAAHPASPTFLYVSRGEGTLLIGAGHPLRAQILVQVPANTPIRIRAKAGAPLALVAFRPET